MPQQKNPPATAILSELTHRLTCAHCHRILCHPLQICTNKHFVCRICLDHILLKPSPQSTYRGCPQCDQPISDIEFNQSVDFLLRHFYTIKQHIGPLVYPSQNTVDTVDNMVVMDLVDAELSDGSETDLDLPEPSSFLQMTASPQDAAERVAVSKDTEIVEMAAAPEVTVMAESEAVEAAAASGLSPKRMPRTRKTKEEATAEDALVGPKKRKTLRECKSSSNADSNVTATNPANPANFPDSLVVLTTGLTDAQLKKVHRAASQAATSATKGLPQFTVHTDLQPSTQYTHLLTSVGRDGRTTRTFKYLYALAGGAHVLRFDWLVDSVRKSQVLSEIKYAVTGDTAMKTCYLDGGLRRVPGRLFVGYRVFVWPGRWDAGSAHSQGDLLRLIQVVGADVIEGKPPGDMLAELSVGVAGDGGGSGSDVRSSTGKFAATVVSAQFRDMFELSVKCRRVVILVDAEDIKGAGGHGVLEEISELTGGLYACRTKSWLFDCISANEIL